MIRVSDVNHTRASVARCVVNAAVGRARHMTPATRAMEAVSSDGNKAAGETCYTLPSHSCAEGQRNLAVGRCPGLETNYISHCFTV